ncbi:MAG: hypothetical protein HC897_02750 [Thermoanaerobaculia bacterium]|nr:hypothetical protein [Thermoanaerobaculia bacterium]
MIAGLGLSFATGDSETQFLGAVLGLLGILLVILRPTSTGWLAVSRIGISFRTPRSRTVTYRLRVYAKELKRLLRQCRGKKNKYADEFLMAWKYDVIEFLDANFKSDVVRRFAELGTEETLQFGEPLQKSYLAHVDFLEQLRSRIESGADFLEKREEFASGNMLPRRDSLKYRSSTQGCQTARKVG